MSLSEQDDSSAYYLDAASSRELDKLVREQQTAATQAAGATDRHPSDLHSH